MTIKALARSSADTALRQEWLSRIEELAHQLKAWVEQEPGWAMTSDEDVEVEEELLGAYLVALWKIVTPAGEVRLEPIARNYPGRGIVELYAWPTLRRVRLLPGKESTWQVRVDSGFSLRQPWDREHFILLVRDLIGADDLLEAE